MTGLGPARSSGPGPARTVLKKKTRCCSPEGGFYTLPRFCQVRHLRGDPKDIVRHIQDVMRFVVDKGKCGRWGVYVPNDPHIHLADYRCRKGIGAHTTHEQNQKFNGHDEEEVAMALADFSEKFKNPLTARPNSAANAFDGVPDKELMGKEADQDQGSEPSVSAAGPSGQGARREIAKQDTEMRRGER